MIPFAETPQGKSLLRQIERCRTVGSTWKQVQLTAVYVKAKDYYEQHNGVPPGQQHDDFKPTEKEISMSLEQAIADLTAALNNNTAALAGAAQAGGKMVVAATSNTPAADVPPKKGPGRPPKAEAKKNEHSREEMVAVLTEVSEKFKTATDPNAGKAAARALFVTDKITKMAEIPESDIDTVYAAAKAKLEEEPEGDADDDM